MDKKKKIIHAHSISGGMNNPPEVEQRMMEVELTGRVTDPDDEIFLEVGKVVHFNTPLLGPVMSGVVLMTYKSQVVIEFDSRELGLVNRNMILTANEYKKVQEIDAINAEIEVLKNRVKDLSK